MPRVKSTSFTDTGTPCSRPSGSPFITAISALSALEWSPDGRLSRASVRLPDGGWVSIEPGAGAAGPWGASDLVTRDGRPLTRLAALDWARVDRIPPLAEPARLPAGAGTA